MLTVANMAKMRSLWILPDTFNLVSICSCTANLNHLHLASHGSFCPKRRGPTLAKTQLYPFPKIVDFEIWHFSIMFIINGGFYFGYLTSLPSRLSKFNQWEAQLWSELSTEMDSLNCTRISVVLATIIIIIGGNVVKQIMCLAFVPEVLEGYSGQNTALIACE